MTTTKLYCDGCKREIEGGTGYYSGESYWVVRVERVCSHRHGDYCCDCYLDAIVGALATSQPDDPVCTIRATVEVMK